MVSPPVVPVDPVRVFVVVLLWVLAAIVGVCFYITRVLARIREATDQLVAMTRRGQRSAQRFKSMIPIYRKALDGAAVKAELDELSRLVAEELSDPWPKPDVD